MPKFDPQAGHQHLLAETLVTEAEIQARCAELGAQISRDYAGREGLRICILRGGVIFLTDLMRHIRVPCQIDLMAVQSYGVGARASNGEPRITLDLNSSIRGRHVLLVEDIVDSGHTIAQVLKILQTREPASLMVCTLLNKQSRRQAQVPLAYVGFEIEDKFVFGYGLDLDEYFRNLPFIGVLKPEYY